jgi:hypothetical protein
MRELVPITVAAIVVLAIVLLLARKFKLSSRYERAPRQLNSWAALDKGIDPTEDEKL